MAGGNPERNKKTRNLLMLALALLAGAWFALPVLQRSSDVVYDGGVAGSTQSFLVEYEGADTVESLRYTIAQKPPDQLVVVMFHAPWCPYCRRLTGHLQKAVRRTDDPFSVIKVDVEKFGGISANMQRQEGIPETFIYRNGALLDHFSGSPATVGEVVNILNDL